jgi:hypothetical protein
MSGLRKRGIGFTSLHEALDTTTPGGRLVLHVFTALAEFIRAGRPAIPSRSSGCRGGWPHPVGYSLARADGAASSTVSSMALDV